MPKPSARYEDFIAALRAGYAQGSADAELIQTGRFGAMMDVSSVNDGPVTFIFDADAAAPPPEVRCTPPA